MTPVNGTSDPWVVFDTVTDKKFTDTAGPTGFASAFYRGRRAMAPRPHALPLRLPQLFQNKHDTGGSSACDSDTRM